LDALADVERAVAGLADDVSEVYEDVAMLRIRDKSPSALVIKLPNSSDFHIKSLQKFLACLWWLKLGPVVKLSGPVPKGAPQYPRGTNRAPDQCGRSGNF